jgi:hypothetical protein
VPWASAPEMGFFESAATYTELLRAAGFEIEKQRGRRDFALAFFAKMREKAAAVAASGGPPPLGLPILMGPSAPVKVGNLMSMIERGMLLPTEIVGRRR